VLVDQSGQAAMAKSRVVEAHPAVVTCTGHFAGPVAGSIHP